MAHDAIQAYSKIDIKVCGEETLKLADGYSVIHPIVTDFGQGRIFVNTSVLIVIDNPSSIDCYRANKLSKADGHMKLWEDAELTQEFTNETMIWIDDLNGEEEDFGLNPIIETDTFWNMNFSIWMELKTLGGAS